MPQGIDFTTGDVMTRLKAMLGMQQPTAMSRIGRTPITFQEGRIDGNLAGQFDPNDQAIRVATGDQSLRQIARTISHEDIHALIDRLTTDPNLNEEVTHNIVRGGKNEASAMERLRRQGFNTEQVERAVRAFKAADQFFAK